MAKRAANKIIKGLLEAAKSAKCDHDWEVTQGTIFRGKMRLVSVCAYCGCRKTEFEAAHK